MKKIYKLDATSNDVIFQGNETKSVEIFAYAEDNNGKITIGYEMMGNEHQICVYDGEVNTSDPGEGPSEEYTGRNEALTSDYSDLFNAIFTLADSMK